ncbi:MAG: hypothetical protein ACJZ36_00920 [Candidatus Pelagibacter sp.]
MKKILAIIILSFLISENSFAKTVKLNCSFKDAYVGMEDGSTKRLTPDMDLYHIYSADDIISFNEDNKSFVGHKADRFNDEIIKVTMLDEIKGPKATVKLKKIWAVNRMNGVFTKEIYSKIVGVDSSWGVGTTIRYDCRKAKKKF